MKIALKESKVCSSPHLFLFGTGIASSVCHDESARNLSVLNSSECSIRIYK
jgi:hypothetical protein